MFINAERERALNEKIFHSYQSQIVARMAQLQYHYSRIVDSGMIAILKFLLILLFGLLYYVML